MRDVLKSSGRRLRGGWFWRLVLLALPACGLITSGTGPAFDPGSGPRTGLVMCDIPKVPEERSNPCATEADLNVGIPLAEAAIALRNGKSSTIGLGLDFSKPCNGMPRKTLFHGPFPDGLAVCLNCGTQIPAVYADANAVCVAKCKDLLLRPSTVPGGRHFGVLPSERARQHELRRTRLLRQRLQQRRSAGHELFRSAAAPRTREVARR